ncbi:MAG TPA: choice-of-anchor R domain-containing protein [Verrucomicrobiae bacterium]|nr:choice-of-anchor R domain-containing protein [Verrucomicrobiae bacterium]
MNQSQWFAEQFNTGNNPGGYTLDSVGLLLGADGYIFIGGGFQVSIHMDNGGKPGTLVQILDGPDNPGATGVTNYAGSNLTLSPSTAYWVVVGVTNDTGGFLWDMGIDYPTTVDGWSRGARVSSTDQGNSWSTLNGYFPQMSIVGRLVEPTTAFAQTGRYFQDFSGFSVGATNFNDGSQLFSTALGLTGGAEIADSTYGELGLTEVNHSSVISAFELPDLNPGAPAYAFSAKWNSQVYGSFNTGAADGFSFNFGQLSSLDLTNGGVESGYGTGLSFGVQTYSGNNPGFYLRANGTVIAFSPFLGNSPLIQWGVNNSTRHFFEVDWNDYTGMSITMDGLPIFSHVPTPGFAPQAGDRFVWAARCGADTEQVRLDNIAVVTGGNLVRAGTTSPYFGDSGTISTNPASAAFDNSISTYWASSASGPWDLGATLVNSNLPVAAYVLTAGPGQALPQFWAIQGSADGGNTWSNINLQAVNFLNVNESRTFLQQSNMPAYNAARLNITVNNNGGAETTADELKLYNFIAVAPPVNASVSAGNLAIAWPSNQFNWVVQENTNLAGTNWVAVTNAVNYVSGQNQLTLPHTNGSAFFRLALP